MVIYFGSIYLVHYLSSMKISKFEDPRMFAIALMECIFVLTLKYIWTNTLITMRQQRDRVIFVHIFLRVLAAPAHCDSSPNRSGNPKAANSLEWGFPGQTPVLLKMLHSTSSI